MLTVNELLQTAGEDLSLVGDGEVLSPDMAASFEGCLNRAIADLNSDNYISLSVKTNDIVAAGSVYFRKLEEGETADNTVDQEPPDAIQGVSRKVGIRWLRLNSSNPQQMDRVLTYSFPTLWAYEVFDEVTPGGGKRRVGKVVLNGNHPTELRIYENSQLPKYKQGDTIYLSPLYHNLILYALEMKLVNKYKLESYRAATQLELTKAMKAIDTTAANNRPLTNSIADSGSYLDCYSDLISGKGF